MRMFFSFISLLALVSIIGCATTGGDKTKETDSVTPKALDLRPHINDIIKCTQSHQLCGEFVSDGGIYDKFVFGDGNQVVIDAAGLEFATEYFINEKTVFIQTDKATIELAIESPSLLNGEDTWTKDQSYARKNIPNKPCAPYSPKQTEIIDLNNQLCFLSGIELQKKDDINRAVDRFLECCDSGHGGKFRFSPHK